MGHVGRPLRESAEAARPGSVYSRASPPGRARRGHFRQREPNTARGFQNAEGLRQWWRHAVGLKSPTVVPADHAAAGSPSAGARAHESCRLRLLGPELPRSWSCRLSRPRLRSAELGRLDGVWMVCLQVLPQGFRRRPPPPAGMTGSRN